MKKVLIYILILFFIAPFVLISDENDLKGIDEISVSVVLWGVNELSREQVITDVELKLRLAGISVVEPSLYEVPMFEVYVNGLFIYDLYSYAVYINCKL